MKQLRRSIAGWIGPRLLRAVQRYVKKKSPEGRLRFGRKLGRFLYALLSRRRRTAISNLAIAFPDKSLEERKRIARASFENMAIESCDFLSSSGRTRDEINSQLQVENRSAMDEAIAEGKGVFLIAGHFGNWERISAWMSLNGYPLSVVARTADQGSVNELINDLRRDSGTEVIGRTRAAVGMVRRLRKKEVVGVVPDQNASECWVEFFGRTAGTVLGPGMIYRKMGPPIVGATCVRLDTNRYRLRFERISDLPEDVDLDGDGVMLGINRWCEKVISQDPEHWLWMHDRWRSARKEGKF